MRNTIWWIGLAASLPFGAMACVDIFHDTDVPTLCDTAPSTPGCGDAGAPDANEPQALCTSNPSDALAIATSACAWLGSCASPNGLNAPGECILQATRAYDCNFDPAHAPRGAREAFWQCLRAASEAQRCEDVMACVFPNGPQRCAQVSGADDAFVCSGEFDAERPFGTRALCTEGTSTPIGGENCAMAGMPCVRGSQRDRCGLPSDDETCTRSYCQGSLLRLCDLSDGGSQGRVRTQLDCRAIGGGDCHDSADGAGCTVAGQTQGCVPLDNSVSCADGEASSCASGQKQAVDCNRLGARCTQAEQSAGQQTHEACTSQPGCVEGCDSNSILNACVAGKAVQIDCAAAGLGACTMVESPEGRHPACSKP